MSGTFCGSVFYFFVHVNRTAGLKHEFFSARADVLLSESDNPLIDRIDQSIASVGYAMGTSSSSPQTISHFPGEDETDGGGVEAAPTSVLANYFLKSHGGAHALQSACSLLAVLSSVGALLIPPLQLVLIKRTMMFTMTKHLSGLLAASTMAARAIPEIGLRRARGWIEKLSLDPVSQYVFYSALILLWLPSDSADIIGKNVAYVGRMTPFLLVGPILMREAVSTAFVISDIMVLLSTTASSSSDGGDVASPSTVLRVGKSVVDAIMSLLVTPSLWRNSDAAKRQAILAKLTSRTSLAMELLVGLLVFVDAVFAVWRFSIGAVSTRPKLMSVAKRLVCARLYINFLWVRRKRIDRLVNKIRGGAMQIPHRVLDALLDPKAAMGLPEAPKVCDANAKSWKDFAIIVLGLDE